MNQYLVPANTKRGQLWFGILMPIDALIFGIGAFVTILAFVIMSITGNMDNFTTILALIPILVAFFLVFPFPNYHNFRVAIGELIAFYTNRQRYKWRGWCTSYEFKD